MWKSDHIVCQQEGGRFYLGTGTTETGKAITGNGIPNLLVEETTGAGDRCCTRFHIFELGQGFHCITTAYTGWGHAEFDDLDNDSALEITFEDWTFAYWHTCFACSPFPKVILKFKNGTYQFASNLMQQPAPPPDEITARMQEVKVDPYWKVGVEYPPDKLWAYMLDLIYTGHADLAWQFFDQAWPTEVPGKTKFLAEFMSQLASSPYWPELKKMNNIYH